MKFTFKKSRYQNFDDTLEDIPEKRSLAYIFLDLLLSPTYRLPRIVNGAVKIYAQNCLQAPAE